MSQCSLCCGKNLVKAFSIKSTWQVVVCSQSLQSKFGLLTLALNFKSSISASVAWRKRNRKYIIYEDVKERNMEIDK